MNLLPSAIADCFCKIFRHRHSTSALGPFLGKGVYVVDVLTWTWTTIFWLFFLSGTYWQYIMKKLKNSLLHFKGV